MLKYWMVYPFSKFLGSGCELQKEDESDALLANGGSGMNEKAGSSSLATQNSNLAQPTVRYVGFGIGGAGNIRRWVFSETWLPQLDCVGLWHLAKSFCFD